MNFFDVLNKILGDPNEKELKRLWPIAHEVRGKYKTPEIQALTLEDLPKETEKFKERIRAGETVDAMLVPAFAVVLRACDLLMGKKTTIGRQEFVWNMAPFDVQILGGIVLHRGNISEMKTGEGKTLVCTMPVYLNALEGKGVHVVTVNDYLAKRDSQWMGLLYEAIGLSVGCIVHGISTETRCAAYASDVTYGTNNEFGFDYLRDNMASSIKRQVQRGLHYAIVDEVDSILIDEARTPLIISQPAEESTVKYQQYAQLVGNLEEHTHFNRDEKQRTAVLTEEGVKKMEQLLGVENIYTERGFEEVHHIEQALRAHAIYKCDVDYVIKEGEIIIVDEFTGRLMPGRRYSHGLHQAIEAKERVAVQRESKTLATITFQNYFRLYGKLAGMTGTAKTEEEEFESIYKLSTIVVPTHRPSHRTDQPDAIYRSVKAKFHAVANIAKEKHERGQPVLVGTTSIEKSEALSLLLKEQGVPHQVLNAKQHEKEAEIIAKAGERGAITIATNMAGRGTDIKLGEGVADLGGLCILGTERHEARRIDNQLRGRSGRQGDPGESRFFVSMEDDLMRLFGGDRLKSMMERLNVPEDVPLENRMVSRAIESAQKKVEGRNFDIRRHVLQYDDVMNKHREIIYKRRQKILEKIASEETESRTDREFSALHTDVLASLKREAAAIVESHTPGEDSEYWDAKEMCEGISAFHEPLGAIATEEKLKSFQDKDLLKTFVTDLLVNYYVEKCTKADAASVDRAETVITLRAIDSHWMDHIDDMSHLREQVAFAGYAQRDPLIEYQDQGFRRFAQLLSMIQGTIIQMLLQANFADFAPRVLVELEQEEIEGAVTNEGEIEGILESGTGPSAVLAKPARNAMAVPESGGATDLSSLMGGARHPPKQMPKAGAHVGRNDPCPCGSGKKYKKCHGKAS